jgi:outer membrane immunogenic protein
MKPKIIVAIAALLAVGGSSSASAQGLAVDSGSNSASAASWLGGAQAGYNWQRSSLVYGLEADISALHLNSQLNTALQGPFAFPPANANTDIDWYGTLRGRIGWSSGPALFYATGGLAYGHVELNSSFSADGQSLSGQTSSVKTGWVAGGGIGYLWRPNVILNLEYQYVDLGTVSLASSTTFGVGGALGQSASTNGRFQTITVGASWLFSPTDGVRHGPWEGEYVGGHVGGARGNDTNASYSFSPPAVSDMRLKRDITLVARLDDGLGLYRYRYLWSDTVYVGVMAQEVALLHPDAIVRDVMDDYLRVDYGRLGLKLMSLSQWEAASKGERP